MLPYTKQDKIQFSHLIFFNADFYLLLGYWEGSRHITLTIGLIQIV
jgi:hypothetical protein